MKGLKSFKDELNLVSEDNFLEFSLELFNFQAKNNPVYRNFIESLKIRLETVKRLEDIPFLPITAFKYQDIMTGNWSSELTFESSGTTGFEVSRHSIQDLDFYKEVSRSVFERFYGNPADYHILALLPSYLERKFSSLVYMVDHLIELSDSVHSGYYLNDLVGLKDQIALLHDNSERKIILWGVTFALLEFAKSFPMDLSGHIIIETGGMKGRGAELVREEVHGILKDAFNIRHVHSEYGMTELLSQAYALTNGRFRCPPWMRVLAREINDPFCTILPGEQGVLNIVDLANIHSCAFIGTDDLGRVYADGTFEVLGRLDNSDVRGCNLLFN